jgi:hypothetical protein
MSQLHPSALVVSIALVLSAAFLGRAQSPTPAPARRFEQRCEKVAPGQFTKTAQAFGAEGYELVTLTSFESTKTTLQAYPYNVDVNFVMCFKREQPNY